MRILFTGFKRIYSLSSPETIDSRHDKFYSSGPFILLNIYTEFQFDRPGMQWWFFLSKKIKIL